MEVFFELSVEQIDRMLAVNGRIADMIGEFADAIQKEIGDADLGESVMMTMVAMVTHHIIAAAVEVREGDSNMLEEYRYAARVFDALVQMIEHYHEEKSDADEIEGAEPSHAGSGSWQ